jgi:hypothetical protein
MSTFKVLYLINFFGGFLSSSIVDTSLGEFNEWAIVGAALVIAVIELFNQIYYSLRTKLKNGVLDSSTTRKLLNALNYFKIGMIYGLIVDAFKLGS